jgi:uncharacterized repeat protein (TIGR03833 family)
MAEQDNNARAAVPGRADVKAGDRVRIVMKQHQRSGETTEGIVQDILTKSSSHPHGIKVRLVTGEVGRVKGPAAERRG